MSLSSRLAALLRRSSLVAPALAAIILGVLAIGAPAPALDRVRDLLFDQFQVWSPRPWSPDLPVRIIAIDDEAIARFGQWPWPRDRMAELTGKLAALGPAAIGFDIVFSEPDRLSTSALRDRLPAGPEREALARALATRIDRDESAFADALAAAPAVISETFLDEGGPPTAPTIKAPIVTLGDDPTAMAPRFARTLSPLPDLARAAQGVGGVNFIPDRDLVIRRAPLLFAVGPAGARTLAPSLAGELLRVAQIDPTDHAHPSPSPIVKSTGASLEKRFGGAAAIVSLRIGALEIPTEADGQARLRYAGHQPGRFLSAARLLGDDLHHEDLDGRIALVGVTAASIGDIRSTPIDGAVPGVEVHAELIEHIVTDARLTRPDYARGVEALMALMGGAVAAFIAARFRPLLSGAAIIGLVALAGWASWKMFLSAAMLFDPLLPSATWLATWSAMTVAVYRRSENERRFVRDAFSRYLAPAVVERLAADPSSLRLGGEAREVSVLFCDARDFTTRSQYLSAEGVVRFLNDLLTPLTSAILDNGGAIDKYLGDGVMAYWNAPVETPDHPTLACRAALDMLSRLPAINARAALVAAEHGREHMPVAIGVGVNTGRAFVGNLGSEQRFDYSLVGDPVNVAARLDAATKDFGVPIVVSSETRERARGFRFVPLGGVALKGRGGETEIFALHGDASERDDGFDDFLRAHMEILRARETNAAPDALARAIAAAMAFPQASRYAKAYQRYASGRADLTHDEHGNVGGS